MEHFFLKVKCLQYKKRYFTIFKMPGLGLSVMPYFNLLCVSFSLLCISQHQGWLFFHTWHLGGFKLQTWSGKDDIFERCKIVFIVRLQTDPQKQADYQTDVHSLKAEGWINNQNIKNYIIVHTHKMAKGNCSNMSKALCNFLCNFATLVQQYICKLKTMKGTKALQNIRLKYSNTIQSLSGHTH